MDFGRGSLVKPMNINISVSIDLLNQTAVLLKDCPWSLKCDNFLLWTICFLGPPNKSIQF